MKILFVDDDEHFLEGVKRHLSLGQSEVTFAFSSSSHEAREMLEREHFDAIIADIRMPGEDGISLLRFVRESTPHAVRVILTAIEDEKTLKDAQDVAHHVFIKPCHTEDIIQSVLKTLKARQ